MSDVPGLTKEQLAKINNRLEAAEELNKTEFRKSLAQHNQHFSLLYGIHETVCNRVKEDITLWLDCAKTLDLQDQHLLRTRVHFMKPTGQLAAAALQAKAKVRAQVLQRGAPQLNPLAVSVTSQAKKKRSRGCRGGSEKCKDPTPTVPSSTDVKPPAAHSQGLPPNDYSDHFHSQHCHGNKQF